MCAEPTDESPLGRKREGICWSVVFDGGGGRHRCGASKAQVAVVLLLLLLLLL